MKKMVNIHFDSLDETKLQDLFCVINEVDKNFSFFTDDADVKPDVSVDDFPVIMNVPGYIQTSEERVGTARLDIDDDVARVDVLIYDPDKRRLLLDAGKVLSVKVDFLLGNFES